MGAVNSLIRKNIRELRPYSSARGEFTGEGKVLLDANENPYGGRFNRYPDPFQRKLKDKLSRLANVPLEQIFLGNGSDEVIDLLIRAFCNPGIDNIAGMSPGYGMYEVAAAINGVAFRKVRLDADFGLDEGEVLRISDEGTRIIFICSPNNPTGNLIDSRRMIRLLKSVNALVVVDEAYIDFSGSRGMIDFINGFPNLVVVRTLSKSWGKAGIRLGMAFANKEVVDTLNKIKPPYNISSLNIMEACKVIGKYRRGERNVKKIIAGREKLAGQLEYFPFVEKVYPSDANFLLVRVDNAGRFYRHLSGRGVIVRDRSGEPGCDNCVRITIGTDRENKKLLRAMSEYKTK